MTISNRPTILIIESIPGAGSYLREMFERSHTVVIISEDQTRSISDEYIDLWNDSLEPDLTSFVSGTLGRRYMIVEPDKPEPLQPEQNWQQMNRGKMSKKARRKL